MAPPADVEPHELDQDDFIAQVQSFEFWFEAVEGYLGDKPYGRDAEVPEPPLDDLERDALVTTLCNYCVGEAAALEASSGLVRLAPNHHAQIFLATQVADEARHLEVFLHRLAELGITDARAEVERRANPGLLAFKERLLRFVDAGDWEAAVFAQNVVLESMEDTVFRFHASVADPKTQQVLEGVVADERRHLGFGENDLGRRLARHPEDRERLTAVRAELDPLVLRSFEEAYEALGLGRDDRPSLGRDYLHSVERLGLTA
ncbi:MAG: ferritin-like domain-containing protein [Acidimicrobiales bacterium]